MRQRFLLAMSVVLCACAPDDQADSGSTSTADARPASAAAPQARLAAAPAAGRAAAEGDLIAEEVAYGATEEHNLNGYMVLPADALDPPAVIMLHEWWGLNDDVRSMARRLAAEGYAVLAVDLFAGQTATSAAQAENLMSAVSGDREAVLDNIGQAYRYLDEFVLAPDIALLGAGMGGRWSLEAGIELGAGIDSVVMFYGRILNDDNLLATLEAPLLGIFAANDESIPVRDVQRFRSLLRDLEKPAQVLIYPDVGHGFVNPGVGAYSPESADEAWMEVLAFLDENLR